MNNRDQINSIDDLLGNDSFKRWILEKDPEDALFWDQWLEEHPEKLELVAMAKVLIVSLVEKEETTEEEVEEQVLVLRNAMQARGRLVVMPRRWWWRVAILLILFFAGYLFYHLSLSRRPTLLHQYEDFVAANSRHGIEYKNTTEIGRAHV